LVNQPHEDFYFQWNLSFPQFAIWFVGFLTMKFVLHRLDSEFPWFFPGPLGSILFFR
jgi:hypothetical protein